LHNEELHVLYFAAAIIKIIKCRRIRWAGHEDNIKVDLIKIGWGDVNWNGFGETYRFHHQGDKKRRARNVSSN
jgi:hypothetical protein